MFNPQLDFGTTVHFENTEYTIDQLAVKIFKQNGRLSYTQPFMELEKGDKFIAFPKQTRVPIFNSTGHSIFKATSDIYRDELGIPCINMEGIANAELR